MAVAGARASAPLGAAASASASDASWPCSAVISFTVAAWSAWIAAAR